ncbi:MAG TPA: BadF/BadG/BcrA/BcrD ATPase family protein [Terriglobales bacterium]|nr:BadF/BadG/BcrA/BcrD ATPase family protein [Terriglobales bacterium]
MSYFLAIDGGGTKTECVIGDERSVLASAVGSTIKIKKVGNKAAAEALQSAINVACRQANIRPDQFSRTCIGLAGSSIPEVTQWTRATLTQLVGGELILVNDTTIAHHAAFNGGPGVLVIAGTGSNVLGINERGESARAGGWGPIISDEGSGFWIGRTAVAQSMRAHDAGRSTELLSAIMQAWRLSGREEVVAMANSNPPPDFAALLPAVLQCADAGDALAREILSSAANELAQLARIVVRKLWNEDGKIPIALTGGVFAHSAQIRQMFSNAIRAERRGIEVNLEPVHPVMGALAMARSQA